MRCEYVAKCFKLKVEKYNPQLYFNAATTSLSPNLSKKIILKFCLEK